jgi:hypothetical protein
MAADGRELCTNPAAQRGYLCRPFTVTAPSGRCPTPASTDPSAITLTSCTAQTATGYTLAGSDVCKGVPYRMTATESPVPFDPQTQCTLNLRCSNNCNGTEGKTTPKLSNGTIDLCVKNGELTVPATYLMYHEIHHALQLCSQPVGTKFYKEPLKDYVQENAAACCRIEGEAYRAQCDLMEQDGLFKNTQAVDGVPLNAETCAEALTDYSCGPRDGFLGCPTSRTYPDNFLQKLIQAEQKNPADVPEHCAAAIDPKTMDPRIQSLVQTVNQYDNVGTPGETSIYVNRIGNNMCYIGQSVEEGLELHRLVGGHAPTGVGDETAPWDAPLTGSPLSTLLVSAQAATPSLPAYRPKDLMQDMETALCQMEGLPGRTPSILCAIEYGRRLQMPLKEQIQNVQSLIGQSREQDDAVTQILSVIPAVGSRIGTALYGDYLAGISRELSSTLELAAQLFTQMNSVSFPTEMCPLTPGLPRS